MRYRESDLFFEFPSSWTVRKYDGTVAYRSLAGHGLKGVDFIALSPDGYLWLIEVKNYRPRFSNQKEYRANRPHPRELGDQVLRKFRDSLRLLTIVAASFRRSWWRRLLVAYQSRRGRPFPHSVTWFWTECQRRADHHRVKYVLWLETPETQVQYDLSVAVLLERGLPDRASVVVAERDRRHNLPFLVTPAA